jgi:carboxymethylenebutenolidase
MIEFATDEGPAKGYLALPEGAGPFPGVIVIHEWWGLNDHTKDIANRFAAEGIAALAPDLYDGKVTKDPNEAGKLMSSLPQESAVVLLIGAAIALSNEYPTSDVGVVGFCMGGMLAMHMACHTERVSAVVAFYGAPPEDDHIARLHAPVFFIGADNDEWVSKDKIEFLEKSCRKHGKTCTVLVPPGTSHAFFNDTRPEVYNKTAAAEVWPKVLDFFRQNLTRQQHPNARL